MTKKLKKWNGPGPCSGIYNKWRINVAAYSQKQAVELIDTYVPNSFASITEIREYFSPCWGNDMEGISPIDPSLYVCSPNGELVRLFPL